MLLENFISILILMFSLCTLIAGIFITYFGSGASRYWGVGLCAVGLIIGLVYSVGVGQCTGLCLWPIITNAALVLIASGIGALIAFGLFILIIIKT